ncbi:MAG: hypothetical protein ACK5A1_19340, partial [Planctomyces sp.]
EGSVTAEGWEHRVIQLQPLNSDYPVINLQPEDSEDLRIIGEFVRVLSLDATGPGASADSGCTESSEVKKRVFMGCPAVSPSEGNACPQQLAAAVKRPASRSL